MIEYINSGEKTVAVVSGCSVATVQDALDIIAQIYFDGCSRMIIDKGALPESFFSLKTGLAGEILQKFSNYGMKLAITGSFTNIKSRSLAAFINESNRGNQVFFKNTREEALEALLKA